MSGEMVGFYHKLKMRCDYCGNSNPNGSTYVIRNPEISGNFCSEQHASYAHKEMKKEKVQEVENE